MREQRSEWAQQLGLTNPIRLQGQYHDHEAGLHYNRYRYYDPSVGRFVSKDPIGYAGSNNPIGWTDPLGRSPRCRYDSNMNPLEKMAHSIHGESLKPGGSPRSLNSESIAVAVLASPRWKDSDSGCV